MMEEKPLESIAARDAIFAAPRDAAQDFNFGKETAEVFDDMLDRSVPYYQEMQRMVGELAAKFAVDNSAVWDLGCSTCNTFFAMQPYLREKPNLRFIGIDSSDEMLKRARRKLMQASFPYNYDLRCGNLEGPLQVEDASVILMLLTLQFVRPLHREKLLRNLYEGLNQNGCIILIEKVLGEDSTFNRLFIEFYYDFKRRNGYSDLEIAQKREALENVLIPYRLNENLDLLKLVGFKSTEVFFKWYNFCGIIAHK